ncbi:mRNA cap guanine-N7 methyltransferase [Agyrium rufum]|nr:mRNA cap guanine-N7 methyltransferase [Agyrium rufum]
MYDPARDIFTSSDAAQTDDHLSKSDDTERKSSIVYDDTKQVDHANNQEDVASTTQEKQHEVKFIESISASSTQFIASEQPVALVKDDRNQTSIIDTDSEPPTMASSGNVERSSLTPSAKRKRSRSPDPRANHQASRPLKAQKSDPSLSACDHTPSGTLQTIQKEPKPARLHGKPERPRISKSSTLPPRRSPPPTSNKRPRSPSPPAPQSSSARRSPLPDEAPRPRKKPGASARLGAAEKETIRARQAAREAEQIAAVAQASATRGVQDVVKQHYNLVPQRGREWRKTDSKIRGLRTFNNWIKSCLIQKFSPSEEWQNGAGRNGGEMPMLKVLDVGCGKGGDLGKWDKAPQKVELYVGVDPAEVSIHQARERHAEMRKGGRGRGRTFHGQFFVQDAFGEWLGDIPIIREVGIDKGVGPGGGGSARWGGGGFDVVSMMFCMHYAFESEEKARGMLRNVAGCLKKGGRFMGVIPNSDILRSKVEAFHEAKQAKAKAGGDTATTNDGPTKDKEEDGEVPSDTPIETPEWGNSLYRVRFPGDTPADGVFRPPFGWKYSYYLDEAVEEVPEYVVPWEAFRALAEDYNLEQQYRKPFPEVWTEEQDDPQLGPLSERMGVRGRDRGPLLVSEEEMEAASFYHAFCFYKV